MREDDAGVADVVNRSRHRREYGGIERPNFETPVPDTEHLELRIVGDL